MDDGAPIRRSIAEIPAISSPRTFQEDHVTDSVSTGWTDEKHSTFLSSMEASFVDELYTNQYMSKDLPGWLSRWMKCAPSTSCYKKDSSSDQCKIPHRRCLNNQNLVSETAKTHVDMKTDSVPLGSNPWIRRLRSITTGKETHSKLPNTINDEFYNQQLQEQSQRYTEATDPNKLPNVRLICPEDSAAGIGEVSDQNFIGDELDTGESTSCKKRRLRSKSPVVVPVNNRVVSLKNSLVSPISIDDLAHLDKGNTESSHRKSKQTVNLLGKGD